jgi:hypothetical protein
MNRRTNYARGLEHGDVHLGPGDEPPLAAHLVARRALYTHHGIYVGDGRVIHYAGFAYGLRRGPVEQISLERFARRGGVRIRPGQRRFDSREVVARAMSRLGEARYRFLSNNCEHFCTWVLRDECRSGQVEELAALPRLLVHTLRTAWRRFRRSAAETRDAASAHDSPGTYV